jgi:AcrR family transcriptional regulator
VLERQEIRLSELPPRERIIYATMTCLERDGMEGLTVRSIAAEASVNVAAVNYYFGSKDALLEEVTGRQLATAFTEPLAELDRLFGMADLDRGEALRLFFRAFMQDMLEYPRTMEAHLHAGLVRRDVTGPAFGALHNFLEGFVQRTRELLPAGSEAEQRACVAQLWSAILFTGLLPSVPGGLMGVPLTDAAAVELWVATLVRRYFPRA